MDIRGPRDGRVLEELGTYDPMVPETDARAVLNGERIDYWLSVGAQPSDKVQRADQEVRRRRDAPGGAAGWRLDRLAQSRRRPEPPPPMPKAEARQAGRRRSGKPAEAAEAAACDEGRAEPC